MTEVDSALVAALSAKLRGRVVHRASPEYDEARALFNAMIDRRPRLIAYPLDASDVGAAVDFGRETGLEIAVRGGAHNGAGFGSVDDGLVIDLSAMRGVEVDPGARTARVLGGTLLGEVDAATHEHGLAAPFGIISTTGVGGLTLGGGVGHLTRTLGLSIDNLLEAEVVLADGSIVTASEDENDDLFWALRGGGGNFGVVTSFTFRLSPISTVITGPMFWPLEQSEEILALVRRLHAGAAGRAERLLRVPLACRPGRPVPAGAAPPEGVRRRLVLRGARRGRGREAPRACAQALDRSWTVSDPCPSRESSRHSTASIRTETSGTGARTTCVRSPRRRVQANVEHGAQLPTWKSAMHMYPIDGAAARVGSSETPWAYRDASWAQVIVGVDPDPANAALIRDWTVVLLGGGAPVLDGRRLRELHDGRGPGPGPGDLRRRTTSGSRRSRRRTTPRTCSTSTRTSARRRTGLARAPARGLYYRPHAQVPGRADLQRRHGRAPDGRDAFEGDRPPPLPRDRLGAQSRRPRRRRHARSRSASTPRRTKRWFASMRKRWETTSSRRSTRSPATSRPTTSR